MLYRKNKILGLVRLIIKYELYITPVTTYILDDFYDEK